MNTQDLSNEDLKTLHAVFSDEVLERIAELEQGLLQLERQPSDSDLLNAIFRAAHTIKGSSSCIGLQDVAHCAHAIEEILDLMRRNRLAPEREIISLLLKATDTVREMVGSLSSQRPCDSSRYVELIKTMEQIKTAQEMRQFKIIFLPDPDLFTQGIDPARIIEDLKNIGVITDIRAHTDAVPRLSEMNHEKLYLRWDILIDTDKDAEEIRKVFEFVGEKSEIKIIPTTVPRGDIPLLGQMLVDEGIVKVEDIDDALRTHRKLGEILVENGKVSAGDLQQVVDKQNDRKIESFKHTVSSTIRVDLGKLDRLMNLVGEMVIINSMVQQIIQDKRFLTDHESSNRLNDFFPRLQRIGTDIQESTLALRMLPVREVFQRFSRLVRELAASKGKNITLMVSGEGTELDKGVLDKITDPLIHLIRNAIDHGIEMPEERMSQGKPAQGTIHLSAYQMGNAVYIEVEDDGRGLNREKILEKAIAQGIIHGASGLTDEQLCHLILLPGFSTADKITDVSGRGVGMDIVKKNIEFFNGRMQIRTKAGVGTTVSIKLPLTLAIIDGLTVSIGDEAFVVPISSVMESLRPHREDVSTIAGKGEVIRVRGEYLPLFRLRDLLGLPPCKREPWDAIVVVILHEREKYCILVDELIGQQQVVIKSIGTAMPQVPDIAGGTILADGRVALVLDAMGIVEMATNSAAGKERRYV
ncbi:MAG TPA: chemotaxis protein CheA [Nitrospiraceae bacterium]|jgi:two-component system chemotaxis sensor kinase CheA|nr:chemotaxis protein CheA [Nitrospiraceae bacterium]